jgi:hypothetical protein
MSLVGARWLRHSLLYKNQLFTRKINIKFCNRWYILKALNIGYASSGCQKFTENEEYPTGYFFSWKYKANGCCGCNLSHFLLEILEYVGYNSFLTVNDHLI